MGYPNPREAIPQQPGPLIVHSDPPSEGGSYLRNVDGTLTRTENPTLPPGYVRDENGTPIPASDINDGASQP